MGRLVGWIVVALAVAGCVSSAPGPASGTAAVAPAGAGEPASVWWSGCEQWHLHFDARAEDFQEEVPPGFVVAADEAGLTTFLIHVTLCQDVSEALLAVPVEAPAEHEDPERQEVAVVQVFHGGHGPAVYPEPFYARLVEARFFPGQGPGGPALTVIGGEETTRLGLVEQDDSGRFGGERWLRVAADATGLGVVAADGNESGNVGFGLVEYGHEGSGGAPPATVGVAHRVAGLDVRLVSEVRR